MIIITSFCEIEVLEQLASTKWAIRDLQNGELSEISTALFVELVEEHHMHELFS